MKTTLRQATLKDARAIAALSGQLGYPDPTGQTPGRLESLVESPDHAVFVACLADGMVVGWCHAFLANRVESDPFAELGGFVVDEEHRGQGIGRSLQGVAEEWVRERGISKLRVRSRSERTRAHGLFRGLGFRLSKEQHVFDKKLDPDD